MAIKVFISILRPSHYLKNLFLFLPLFFVFKITDIQLLWKTTLAFIPFSLVASALYILNDLCDLKDDRNHPFKKERPLASGRITAKAAIVTMFLALGCGLILLLIFNPNTLGIILMYIILNVAYSLRLKHFAIIDIAIISIGFVIRLFVGSQVTNIPLSAWIVVNTFLLAMFLGLAKRRDDMAIFLETGQKMRKSIDGYSIDMLNGSMFMMASITILAYIMYTVSEKVVLYFHTDKLYLTALFVLLGIMRYLQITLLERRSGSPTEVLLKDKFIQVCIIGWIMMFMFIIYSKFLFV